MHVVSRLVNVKIIKLSPVVYCLVPSSVHVAPFELPSEPLQLKQLSPPALSVASVAPSAGFFPAPAVSSPTHVRMLA